MFKINGLKISNRIRPCGVLLTPNMVITLPLYQDLSLIMDIAYSATMYRCRWVQPVGMGKCFFGIEDV